MCASGQTGRPPNWLQFEANDIWMHSTISALNSIRLFKYTGPTLPAVEWVRHVEKDVGIVLSDVVGNLLHHCNHRQPCNCRRYQKPRIQNRERCLRFSTSWNRWLGRSYGSWSGYRHICLRFGVNILISNYITRHQSISSLDFMKSSIFCYLGPQNRSVPRYCRALFLWF